MRKSKKKIGNYLIDFDKPIGKGTYGKVFICNCVTTNEEYAIKIIDKSYRKCTL